MHCVTNYGDNIIAGHNVVFSSYMLHALFGIVFKRTKKWTMKEKNAVSPSIPFEQNKWLDVEGLCIKLWPQATYQDVLFSITQMTKLPLRPQMEINIMAGDLSQNRPVWAAARCIRSDQYLDLSASKHIQ